MFISNILFQNSSDYTISQELRLYRYRLLGYLEINNATQENGGAYACRATASTKPPAGVQNAAALSIGRLSEPIVIKVYCKSKFLSVLPGTCHGVHVKMWLLIIWCVLYSCIRLLEPKICFKIGFWFKSTQLRQPARLEFYHKKNKFLNTYDNPSFLLSAEKLEFVKDDDYHSQHRTVNINNLNKPDGSISYALKSVNPRKKLVVTVDTDGSLLQWVYFLGSELFPRFRWN